MTDLSITGDTYLKKKKLCVKIHNLRKPSRNTVNLFYDIFLVVIKIESLTLVSLLALNAEAAIWLRWIIWESFSYPHVHPCRLAAWQKALWREMASSSSGNTWKDQCRNSGHARGGGNHTVAIWNMWETNSVKILHRISMLAYSIFIYKYTITTNTQQDHYVH